MLIEVQHWNLDDTARERETERLRLEFERRHNEQFKLEVIGERPSSFEDCPTCKAPPQPQRHGVRINSHQPTQQMTSGFTGQSFIHAQGPEEKMVEFTCKCGTELTYSGVKGQLALVDWTYNYTL